MCIHVVAYFLLCSLVLPKVKREFNFSWELFENGLETKKKKRKKKKVKPHLSHLEFGPKAHFPPPFFFLLSRASSLFSLGPKASPDGPPLLLPRPRVSPLLSFGPFGSAQACTACRLRLFLVPLIARPRLSVPSPSSSRVRVGL